MTKITNDNYREYDAINYSLLSQLDRNPSGVNKDVVETEGMIFGTLVDMMCFEPNRVKDTFYVSDADREPSKTAKLLADYILENNTNFDTISIDTDSVVLAQTDNFDNVANLSDLLEEAKEALGKSTSFEKYGGVEYLREQLLSKDKYVISQEEYNRARQAMMTLKTHPFTKKYFHTNDPNIDIHFQVPILWEPSEWDDEIKWQSKSLLDILIINHDKKTVTPVDLKTTSSSPYRFESSLIKWRYYLQASYYWYATLQSVKEDEDLKDYDVMPFEFVVISKKALQHPFVFTTNYRLLECGKDGGHIKRWDTDVRGWRQLIKDLKWHEKEDKWDYPREVYENNGKQELDIFE